MFLILNQYNLQYQHFFNKSTISVPTLLISTVTLMFLCSSNNICKWNLPIVIELLFCKKVVEGKTAIKYIDFLFTKHLRFTVLVAAYSKLD